MHCTHGHGLSLPPLNQLEKEESGCLCIWFGVELGAASLFHFFLDGLELLTEDHGATAQNAKTPLTHGRKLEATRQTRTKQRSEAESKV